MVPGPELRAGYRRMSRPLWCLQRATEAKAYSICLITRLLNKSHPSPSRARWVPHGEMLRTRVIYSLQALSSSPLSPYPHTYFTPPFFFKETLQFNMYVTFDPQEQCLQAHSSESLHTLSPCLAHPSSLCTSSAWLPHLS